MDGQRVVGTRDVGGIVVEPFGGQVRRHSLGRGQHSYGGHCQRLKVYKEKKDLNMLENTALILNA